MTVIINGTTGITSVNGTAAAPSVTGTDTDTGVYSPTSNQVALAAGGTMALVATSGQQVGVAVVPSSEWTSQDLFQVSSSSIYSTLSLATYRTVSTGNRIGSLVFEMPNNTANYRTRAEIACEMTGSTANKFGGTIRLNIAGDNVVSNSMTNSAVFNQYGMGLNATPSSGTGITFPATQSASTDANTLDDYEEGTWTPVLNRVGTAPSVTYTRQVGTYVKIGKFVYVNCEIYISSVASQGTSYNCVTGFPFPVSNTNASWYDIGGSVKYNTIFVTTVVDRLSGGGGQGANGVSFLPANTSGTSEVNTNYQGGYLTFTAVYQTTA